MGQGVQLDKTPVADVPLPAWSIQPRRNLFR